MTDASKIDTAGAIVNITINTGKGTNAMKLRTDIENALATIECRTFIRYTSDSGDVSAYGAYAVLSDPINGKESN